MSHFELKNISSDNRAHRPSVEENHGVAFVLHWVTFCWNGLHTETNCDCCPMCEISPCESHGHFECKVCTTVNSVLRQYIVLFVRIYDSMTS